MWIKICGITSVHDAQMVERAGVESIGLNFVSHSKRYISVAQAAQISAALGPFICRVGVFVNATLDEVISTVQEVGLDVVQLHGDEDDDYAAAVKEVARVIRALRVRSEEDVEIARNQPADIIDAVLVDGAVPGSGHPFSWQDARGLQDIPRLILAGGLTSANVQLGIETLLPYGVDLASGVESSPGVKDATKVQDFVIAARGLTSS
ncbi:MAG: phosphoribosylanthranilate isomerase [Deinococcota bacterium]